MSASPQCSRLKSSILFKCDLALQNIPLSKQQPQIENKTSLEVLNIICLPQVPTSVGHHH